MILEYLKLYDEEQIKENEEEVLKTVRAHAFVFLQSGGTIDLMTWLGFHQVERRAFFEAGAQLDAKRAVMTGRAVESREGLLAVWAEVDEGRAHDEHVIRKTLEDMSG